MVYRTLALMTILGLLVSAGVQLLSKKKTITSVEDSDLVFPKKITSKAQRYPASSPPEVTPHPSIPVNNGPTYKTSEISQGTFDERSELSNAESSPDQSYSSSQSGSQTPQIDNSYSTRREASPGGRQIPSRGNANSSGTTQSPSGSYVAYGTNTVPVAPKPSAANNSSSGSASNASPAKGSSSSPTVPVAETLSCSSSVGSGTYSYTFSVNLTCSTSASIQYCVSEGSCCDPTMGSDYSSPVAINMGAGSYCLSFIGENANGVQSQVEQRTFNLNPEAPDLQVAHQKKYFQTTELNGVMNLTSHNFEDPSMSVGVINLKSHNPGPSELNWDCNEIVTHYSTLSGPSTSMVMSDTPATLFNLNTQIDIFLRPMNLSYGSNYLTSYVRNNNYVEAVTSCSTTQITLEDFEHFDFLPYSGVPGTNDVREFSGGFTHLGFYEPETSLYRGPAGSSTESVSNQEMESNLFDIFY